MSSYRIKLWNYSLFQIPLICFGLCLIAAALFWLLGFGRPRVTVAIALDLSSSTYNSQAELFNRPGTVLSQEIEAVQDYLKQNNEEILRRPNQVRVFGFGGTIKPLTGNFDGNSKKVAQALVDSLSNPRLAQEIVPNNTDINLAIKTGVDALKIAPKSCRELILVTDGQASVSPIVVAQARANKVQINSVVVGEEALALRAASLATGGIYLSGNGSSISTFFTDNFFNSFNSNLKWIVFWLGLAWICLMWTLVLPLDRWLFQGLLNLRIDQAGRLAISQALFWTVATLSAIWKFWGIPFLSGC
ncbi:MAG: vWA domain-containing protein [Waterburya sp.]